MATRPPQPPPPRDPIGTPPERPSPWRLILKVALYVGGAAFLVILVGLGLVAAACGGLFG